jgi:hypothetical protein
MAKVTTKKGVLEGTFGDKVAGTSEFKFFFWAGFFPRNFSIQKKLLGALDTNPKTVARAKTLLLETLK